MSTDNKATTFCVNNEMYETSISRLPPQVLKILTKMYSIYANLFQPVYEEADFSSSHDTKLSVVDKALSTMKRTRPLSYEEPLSLQSSLDNNLYELPRSSTHEMAESIEAEQLIYDTPCEGEESIGPIYSAPSCDEQKIYEEFEGKWFRKLHHNEVK